MLYAKHGTDENPGLVSAPQLDPDFFVVDFGLEMSVSVVREAWASA